MKDFISLHIIRLRHTFTKQTSRTKINRKPVRYESNRAYLALERFQFGADDNRSITLNNNRRILGSSGPRTQTPEILRSLPGFKVRSDLHQERRARIGRGSLCRRGAQAPCLRPIHGRGRSRGGRGSRNDLP